MTWVDMNWHRESEKWVMMINTSCIPAWNAIEGARPDPLGDSPVGLCWACLCRHGGVWAGFITHKLFVGGVLYSLMRGCIWHADALLLKALKAGRVKDFRSVFVAVALSDVWVESFVFFNNQVGNGLFLIIGIWTLEGHLYTDLLFCVAVHGGFQHSVGEKAGACWSIDHQTVLNGFNGFGMSQKACQWSDCKGEVH